MEVAIFCLKQAVELSASCEFASHDRYPEFLLLKSALEENISKIGEKFIQNTQVTNQPKIWIHGLATSTNPSTEVASFFKSKMNIQPEIKEVTVSNNSSIAVTLNSEIDRRKIFGNCHKLKGLRIGITEDLSVEDRRKRSQLYFLLHQAKAQGKKAFIRGTSLFIDGAQHYERPSPETENNFENPNLEVQSHQIQSSFLDEGKDCEKIITPIQQIEVLPTEIISQERDELTPTSASPSKKKKKRNAKNPDSTLQKQQTIDAFKCHLEKHVGPINHELLDRIHEKLIRFKEKKVQRS